MLQHELLIQINNQSVIVQTSIAENYENIDNSKLVEEIIKLYELLIEYLKI